MYLRVNIDDDCFCWQRWCDLSWLSSMLIFIDIVVVYRTASSVTMSLAVITTLIEMFWCTTTFWKEHYTAFLTVNTTDRNQHTLTLNQNCIDVWWLMSSHLIQCDTKLYKQNIHIRQHKNDHCLRKVSIQNELLLINKENWIIISSCKNENNNICIIKNKSFMSCQL